MSDLLARPSVLGAVDAPKPWGWELWLTSTSPPARAIVPHAGCTLSDLVTAHSEVLGGWARRLFGDAMPMFAKFIHTDFPSRVHLGFRRAVERGQMLAWLDQEQALLRSLFTALRLGDEETFTAFQACYSAWATRQALSAWRIDDDMATAFALRRFVDPSFRLFLWLRDVRANRAALVDSLNEVDLKEESGNLLLTSAGVVHAIFGLSHQTHPLDRSRAALEALFAALAERAEAGANDEELTRIIDAANLPALRAGNRAPPKNEAWLPAVVSGAEVLVEPQQTSDTTYSLADFYTPLVWSGDHVRFRKGAAASGLSQTELAGYLDDVDFAVTPVASLRRAPKLVPGAGRQGAELHCLVDEPVSWPFFTTYQLELTGSLSLRSPPGAFQQLVVTRGRVALGDAAGEVGELSPRAPGFIPATLANGYTLSAREPSTVLLISVPGARGGAPIINPP